MICQRFDRTAEESFRTKGFADAKSSSNNTATVKVVTIAERILFPSRRAKHFCTSRKAIFRSISL